MEQQTACNHTVQNTETNSNYLFESMSHMGFLSLTQASYPSIPPQGNNNSDFQLHASTVSHFLGLFPKEQPPIAFRYDGSVFKTAVAD